MDEHLQEIIVEMAGNPAYPQVLSHRTEGARLQPFFSCNKMPRLVSIHAESTGFPKYLNCVRSGGLWRDADPCQRQLMGPFV